MYFSLTLRYNCYTLSSKDGTACVPPEFPDSCELNEVWHCTRVNETNIVLQTFRVSYGRRPYRPEPNCSGRY